MINYNKYDDMIRCPVCKHEVNHFDGKYHFVNDKCKSIFPVIKGIPVLINEQNSAFSIKDFTLQKETTMETKNSIIRMGNYLVPSLNLNVTAKENLNNFKREVLELSKNPKILVLGCRQEGHGMQALSNDDNIILFNTDVSLGNNTGFVVDAHDIPFSENTFDGVIIQTVLEHVADPSRCVDEIHRFLKNNGIVYAETSFNQQVHMGAYDFSRFTHVGHRRLFRMFSEIDSGVGSGPGMALAWAY